jgi:hypothetical protein
MFGFNTLEDRQAVIDSFAPKEYYVYQQIVRRSGVSGEDLIKILEDLTVEGRLEKTILKGELYPSWRINQ